MANREIKKVSISRRDFQNRLDECGWSKDVFARYVDRNISTIRKWAHDEMIPTYAYDILMHRVRLSRKENIYIRSFNYRNPNWEYDLDYTMYYLRTAELVLKNKLEAKGILFLNDVYDYLGYDRTFEGQLKGWTYDPNENKVLFITNKDEDNDSLELVFVTDGHVVTNLRSETEDLSE